MLARSSTTARSYSPPIDAEAFAGDLQKRIRGEVRFDDGSRALYATDASNCRQVPIGPCVLIPPKRTIGRFKDEQTSALWILPPHVGTLLARGVCGALLMLSGVVSCSTISILLSGPRLNDELKARPVTLDHNAQTDSPSARIRAALPKLDDKEDEPLQRAETKTRLGLNGRPESFSTMPHAISRRAIWMNCSKRGEGMTGEDHKLKKKIERRLTWTPSVDAEYLIVCASKGIATLSGWVEDDSEMQDAIKHARAAGAEEVVNELRLLYSHSDITPHPWFWLFPSSVTYEPVTKDRDTEGR